jgi:hypothetical protein
VCLDHFGGGSDRCSWTTCLDIVEIGDAKTATARAANIWKTASIRTLNLPSPGGARLKHQNLAIMAISQDTYCNAMIAGYETWLSCSHEFPFETKCRKVNRY